MDKNELLEAFQTYLEDCEELPLATESSTDLYTLLTEMASLRTEVKAESRQFKTALDDFKQVFEGLNHSHDAVSSALARSQEEQKKQVMDAQRHILLDLLDVYDRMTAGLEALQHYTPGFFGGKAQKAFIDNVHEGQSMTLRRVTQMLERYHVHPIETLGQPLEPHQMRAVETANNPAYADACVVEEIRKGFLWHQDVLRLAEVKVNKLA